MADNGKALTSFVCFNPLRCPTPTKTLQFSAS